MEVILNGQYFHLVLQLAKETKVTEGAEDFVPILHLEHKD